MTTKDQERKALEAIKKILAGLDEDGYVATAMKGVLEDAHDNIENDWAMSRFDAWNNAAHELEDARDEIAKLRKELQAANERIDGLIADMNSRTLDDEELGLITAIANDYKSDSDEEMVKAAAEIVAYAEEPDCREFRDAVFRHRMAGTQKTKCTRLLDSLRVKFDI